MSKTCSETIVSASLYTQPPLEGIIEIREFKEFTSKRFEILQLIDKLCGNDQSLESAKQDDIRRQIKPHLVSAQLIPPDTNTTSASVEKLSDEYYRRRDQISHFALRLAFSRDQEKYAWFMRQESQLLLVKLGHLRTLLTADQMSSSRAFASFGEKGDDVGINNLIILEKFLKHQGIEFPVVDCCAADEDEEFVAFSRARLAAWGVEWRGFISGSETLNASIMRGSGRDGYVSFAVKVPFWPDAISFVKQRQCYLSDGFAYIPLHQLDALVISHYNHLLKASYTLLASRASYLESAILSDPRTSQHFKALQLKAAAPINISKGLEATIDGCCERLFPQNLQKMQKRSFPPCMRRVSEALRHIRHLKYNGRLQLWLFFKGCGMSMDEQLVYWRSIWHDAAQFDKQHKYNIRHAYGLEGRRQAYNAQPCARIIHSLPNPGVGEVHGCPFKTFDEEPLSQLLQSFGVKGLHLKASLELAESHHHELACVEVFKATHPNSTADGVGTHPIQYYKQSCLHWERFDANQDLAVNDTSSSVTGGSRKRETMQTSVDENQETQQNVVNKANEAAV